MPSGPELFVTRPEYTREIQQACDLLHGHPGRWRVIYHYDGDGIASASVALRALQRLNYPFQATPLVGVEKQRIEALLTATPGPVWVVDTGASWLDVFARHPHPVLILDHHRYPPHPTPLPNHVVFVNPLHWGVDGMSEMCASTLTWLYTIFLDEKNWANAPWGLSGAIADRQHVGGFRGLNQRLVEEAEKRKLLTRHRSLALRGATLQEALATSIDPYLRGISGHPSEAASFVRSLGMESMRSPETLSIDERERLATALEQRLREANVRPEFVATLQREQYDIPSLGMDAEELANLQNATGRMGEPSVGLALALGDPDALQRAQGAEARWREGILRGLRRIEHGEIHTNLSVQWFDSPDSTLAGTQAGLALAYLLNPEQPVFSFTEAGEKIRISARGTLYLVGKGLDLSEACRTAATRVGGEGGGHRVASGATIPATTQPAFLEHVSEIIAHQLPQSRNA